MNSGLPIIRAATPPAGQQCYRLKTLANVEKCLFCRILFYLYIWIYRQEENMPNRTKYVPVFRSQLSCSQSGTSQPERTTVPNGSPTQIRRFRPRTNRDIGRLLKVKLPKFRKGKNTEEKTSMKSPTEPVVDTSVCREEAAPPASRWYAN